MKNLIFILMNVMFITTIYGSATISPVDVQPKLAVPQDLLNPSETLTTPGNSNLNLVQNSLSFSEGWARPTISNTPNSAAYFKINNYSGANLVLLGASAISVANKVELHQSYVDEKGISRMIAVDKVLIPAQTTVELKPGGMHIMLLDLKRRLNTGDKISIDLKFEEIGSKKVELEVKD